MTSVAQVKTGRLVLQYGECVKGELGQGGEHSACLESEGDKAEVDLLPGTCVSCSLRTTSLAFQVLLGRERYERR